MNLDRALSIQQPWGELIIAGHKPVENRTWMTLDTGRFIVHAGKKIDPYGFEFARSLGIELDPVALPTGCYIGTVHLDGVHQDQRCCRPWGGAGLQHWALSAPHRFASPVPGAGQLGLFGLPDNIRPLLEQQWTRT